MTDYRVLNTRPMPMAEELQVELDILHISSIQCPVINNQTLETELDNWQTLLNNPDCHWVFISKPAVNFFTAFVNRQNSSGAASSFIPKGQVFGVGPSTKATLEQHYSNLSVFLPEEFNSEALLVMPELLSAKQVVLVKGVGGRGLIQQTLQAHDIEVIELDLYQRQVAEFDEMEVQSWLKCNLIMATSVDIAKAIWQNLGKLSETQRHEFLQNKSWLVLSERIKAFLMQLNVPAKYIYVCEQSDNSSIIKLIKQLAK